MQSYVKLTSQNGELYSNDSTVSNSVTEFLIDTALNQNVNLEIDYNTVATIYNNAANNTYNNLGSGMSNGVLTIAVDSNNNIYAGGYFTYADGNPVNYIAKWNGTTWSALIDPSGNNGLNGGGVSALAIDSNNNLYVGGWFSAAGGIAANRIAKWNGTNWSALIDISGNNGLNGNVTSLKFDSNDNLYVGGYFTTAGGITANRIAKWNGTSWSALIDISGINGFNNGVTSLAFDSNDNLYAGGFFTTAGETASNYIAKWNGSSWSALGSGFNTTVLTLAFDSNNNLYAGGYFTSAGETAANYIAKWNGSSWSALGSGFNSPVFALAFDSTNNLYAGGSFNYADGNPSNYIAKWNGSSWYALGNGFNNVVQSLALDSNNNLCAGGSFNYADGNAANYIVIIDLNTILSLSINNKYINTLINNQYQMVNVYQNGNVYKGYNGYN